jgi:hypothetical protein
MQRYIPIPCRFYQPLRRNPSPQVVGLQNSASPFHDWNERVTPECRLPNGAGRILDGRPRLAKIVNHYSRAASNANPAAGHGRGSARRRTSLGNCSREVPICDHFGAFFRTGVTYC